MTDVPAAYDRRQARDPAARRPRSCAPGSRAGAPTSTPPTARRTRKLQYDPERYRRALGLPGAAARSCAARALHRARVPDAGVRHRPAAARGSGALRRLRLRPVQRGPAAHWLLLMLADRVDAVRQPPPLAARCTRTTRSPRPGSAPSSRHGGPRRGGPLRRAPPAARPGHRRRPVGGRRRRGGPGRAATRAARLVHARRSVTCTRSPTLRVAA